MLEFAIIAEQVVSAKGDGPPVDISAAQSRVLLLTLRIADIVEQESLDVSVWGSADGAAWGDKAIAAFPQKFYRGEHPLLLDLSSRPQVKFLRAHWECYRWGRGSEKPMFRFSLQAQEVPKQVLAEVSAATR